MPFRILIAHFSLAFNNISCLNIPLFINSPTEGHLGCFQFLTIMNKTNVKLHGRLRPAHLSVAERSYPMSEVRGRNQEDPMPEGWWPEELPHVRGQGPGPRGATPPPKSRGCADTVGPTKGKQRHLPSHPPDFTSSVPFLRRSMTGAFSEDATGL